MNPGPAAPTTGAPPRAPMDPLSGPGGTTGALALVVLAAVALASALVDGRAWRAGAVESGALAVAPGHGHEQQSGGVRIDLNTADAGQLELLPRIGPALARRIVEDRARRGPFQTLDDLARVKGIGPRTIAALAAHATVGGIAPAPGPVPEVPAAAAAPR